MVGNKVAHFYGLWCTYDANVNVSVRNCLRISVGNIMRSTDNDISWATWKWLEICCGL